MLIETAPEFLKGGSGSSKRQVRRKFLTASKKPRGGGVDPGIV